MRTTATMMFGVGETFEHRINHFQRVYELQEETGGFTAFIPWSFQPGNTALGGRHWEEATAVEYLKVLAIARLYLSNFKNVQSSWVTQGLKVCQLGLRFGGNDVGSVMLEENVVRSAGVTNCTTEEELRRMIRDARLRAEAAGYVVSAVVFELRLIYRQVKFSIVVSFLCLPGGLLLPRDPSANRVPVLASQSVAHLNADQFELTF